MKALLVLLGVAATPCCAESRSEPKMESSPWTLSASWRAAASNRTASPVPKVSISLDVAPENRWDHVTPAFVHVVPAIMDYLKSEVPGWALPLLSKIGASVRPYFGAEYGAEMEGLAKGLGLDPGYIVFLNLIMQVEGIGINCSNWNSTGPTHKDDPGCTAVDPSQVGRHTARPNDPLLKMAVRPPSQKWCYCKDAAAVDAIGQDGMLQFHRRSHTDGPGLCTSVVAQTVIQPPPTHTLTQQTALFPAARHVTPWCAGVSAGQSPPTSLSLASRLPTRGGTAGRHHLPRPQPRLEFATSNARACR